MSPTYLEYLVRDRLREHEELTQEILASKRERELQPVQPGGLRRRLGRRLIALGLSLESQAKGPTAP